MTMIQPQEKFMQEAIQQALAAKADGD